MSDNTSQLFSELTPLAQAVAADDFIHIVDKSDTTQSPEGSSKRVDISAIKTMILAEVNIEVANNAANIAANAVLIADNALAITGNDTDIAANATNIAANALAISSNDTDIAANALAIANNDTDIAANATAIATNAANIAANGGDITANALAIAANAASIAANAILISDNTSDIAANAVLIAANTLAAGNNASDIVALQADINLKQSQLEKITENGKTGWRLLGATPDNYGDIGADAVDLSESDAASTTHGAVGENSFAANYKTTASGAYSVATGRGTTASGVSSFASGRGTAAGNYSSSFNWLTEATGDYSASFGYLTKAKNTSMLASGKHNVGASDHTIHETGIGTSVGSEANAYEIYYNGVLTAPELTIALIDDPTSSGDFDGDAGKVLVTKEWAKEQVSTTVQWSKKPNLNQGTYLDMGKITGTDVNGMSFSKSYKVIGISASFGIYGKGGDWSFYNNETVPPTLLGSATMAAPQAASLTTPCSGDITAPADFTAFTLPANTVIGLSIQNSTGGNSPKETTVNVTLQEV